MLQKLKYLSVSLSSFLLLVAPLAFASGAGAVSQQSLNQNTCAGSNGQFNTSGTGEQIGGKGGHCAEGGTSINHIITVALNVLSIVVGIIAVIMIIVAGLKYVTSGGKDEGVKSAKNTILYAVIGLVIVALAQVIVHFVLSTTNSQVSS